MKNLYHYKECGLDNVFLSNGYTVDEEGNLFVQDIHGLYAAIAETIVFLGRKLKGKEVRFIRHYLDLSQKGLATLLGVEYITVHRWETGKVKITKTAEKFLKTILYDCLNKKEGIREIIERLSDFSNHREKKDISFSHKNSGWVEAA